MENNRVEAMFVPYSRIIIGSNEISCRYLININGFYPIIIGKGNIPHIWLKTQVKGNEVTLVDDNKESFKGIRVILDESNKQISIIISDKPTSDYVILLASYANEDTFVIKKMDLTPIGLSVVSNENELFVGKNRLTGNMVMWAESFIGLSE